MSEIKAAEQAAGTSIPASLNLQKGMFLVLLYGSFEFAVTQMIQQTADLITSKNVKCEHLDHRVYGLALDPELKSISTPGGKGAKWKRRGSLFERLVSPEPARIYESALTSDLGNLWVNALMQVFEAFGFSASPLYDPRVKQYIDELVDKRNEVAHGRSSPIMVGQSYNAGDLERRIEEIERQREYLFSVFEEFLKNKEYVRPAHQAAY